MAKFKDFARNAINAKGTLKQGTLSRQYTGIDASRPNPATGDVGPDAPRDPKGPRDRPRGRNRRVGGDVRSPLSP